MKGKRKSFELSLKIILIKFKLTKKAWESAKFLILNFKCFYLFLYKIKQFENKITRGTKVHKQQNIMNLKVKLQTIEE